MKTVVRLGTGDVRVAKGFLRNARLPAFIGMVLLAAVAVGDFFLRDSSRVLMTFYTVADGQDLVEERLVKNAGTRDIETRLRRYVEDVLLGPLSYGAAGFFPAGVVQSCIVNGETAYIGLPVEAALAGVDDAERGYVVDSVRAVDVLKKDIGRNFPQLKNIVIFIGGRET